MDRYQKIVTFLLGLLIAVQSAYIHRLPGLMGDEGSEGENVYELLQREGITVTGERSYIGPVIDYVRVPFILTFGYTTFAIRLPILLFSIVTFLLAASVLRRTFTEIQSVLALTAFIYNPIYLTQQRIGWAITLFPFFTFLILFLAQRSWKTKWLWIGLAAGIGLANHIIFLATIIGLAAGGIVRILPDLIQRQISLSRIVSSFLLLIIGFWAGFGMQFTVLHLQTDDQGNPSATTQLFSERVTDFINAAPLYVSGSSYVARYTGVEFSPTLQISITAILTLLIIIGSFVRWRSITMWAWLFGLHIHLLATLYIIDRFTLRYFVVYTLGVWLLAGLGLGSIVSKIRLLVHIASFTAIPGALVLVAWVVSAVFIPFLRTGGSTNEFDLGNRNDSASALVDIRPLIECLENRGMIFSENVHIWNRLQYLSHSNMNLQILPEDRKKEAEVLIEYIDNNNPQPGQICPELRHFRTSPN